MVGLHLPLRRRGEKRGQAQFLELLVQVMRHFGDHRVVNSWAHLELTQANGLQVAQHTRDFLPLAFGSPFSS